MKAILYIAVLFVSVSCLKKVEQVETANTNIFYPDYAGGQWFVFDDVSIYTNQNNDQRLKFEFTIPESYAPDLQPTEIDLGVKINDGAQLLTIAHIKTNGSYEGIIEINPTG